MLKIKDVIDLKELEKFGFKKVEKRVFFSDWYRAYERIEETNIYKCKISIHIEDSVEECRTINIGGTANVGGFGSPMFSADNIMEILFDLIQAGLVEKV